MAFVLPRQPLTSAPYALRAATADNAERLGGQLPADLLAWFLETPQTATGLMTFNPTSGAVPLAVGATKTGLVANLNADLLDDQHVADAVLLPALHEEVARSHGLGLEVEGVAG